MKLADYLFRAVAWSFFGFILSGISNNSFAAEFTLYNEPFMGCHMKMSGPIEVGDVKKFEYARRILEKQYPNQYFPWKGNSSISYSNEEYIIIDTSNVISEDEVNFGQSRICLDSVGGSFSEALKIADEIAGYWGTAIEANSVCLSACAIVFMAGSATDDEFGWWLNDRVLHAKGKLGFHTPSLVIPDGEYDASTVQEAFRAAIDSIAGIQARQYYLEVGRNLLGAMLETPSDEMFYIETVGQAARWQIEVVGTKWPKKVELVHLASACIRIFEAIQEFTTPESAMFISENHPIRRVAPAGGLYSVLAKSSHLDSLNSINMESISLKDSTKNDYEEDGYVFSKRTASSITNIVRECKIFHKFDKEGISLLDITTALIEGDFGPFILWPAETNIKDIAADRFSEPEFVELPEHYISNSSFSNSRCTLFSKMEIIDDEICSRHEYDIYGSDMKLLGRQFEFTGPSGSKTIATSPHFHEADQQQINGDKAIVYKVYDDNDRQKLGSHLPSGFTSEDWYYCWENLKSKNIFCEK